MLQKCQKKVGDWFKRFVKFIKLFKNVKKFKLKLTLKVDPGGKRELNILGVPSS